MVPKGKCHLVDIMNYDLSIRNSTEVFCFLN